MPKYRRGGYVEGTGQTGPTPVFAGEEVVRPDGEVFRFEPCDGGLVLKPTGKRYDLRAALENLNARSAR